MQGKVLVFWAFLPEKKNRRKLCKVKKKKISNSYSKVRSPIKEDPNLGQILSNRLFKKKASSIAQLVLPGQISKPNLLCTLFNRREVI